MLAPSGGAIRLISQGSAWNIGNGQSVDIWNDKWLPGISLLELRPSECEFQKVCDLMVDDGSAWDVEGTTHKNFTVRDAYKKGLANIGLTNNLSYLETQICSSLWKATILMKVKLFIWRTWPNSLPTICNLQRRHVILNNGLCVHCNDPNEDVQHALFQCDRVRQVWEAVNFINISSIQNKDSVNDYFEVVVSDHHNKWEAFLMICWGLWLERNRIAHEQSPQNCRLIWQSATRLLQEFQDAAMRGNAENGTNVNVLVSIWQPPPYGFVKVNCDAAWLTSSKQAGIGFVARNSEGEVILSGAKHVEYSQSAIMAEAEAVCWAVKTGQEKQLTRIEVETDSFVLYQSLSIGKPLLQISSIWQDIRELASTFKCCHWTFVKRSGNVVDHSIARWALGDNAYSVVDGLVHLESSFCTPVDDS
ncbi:reverse transcriptase [Tanacetum coccineum]|uniref:Reverse transcriptase n=1 Tax=Tanacetum coccineum TaxID=301880 RepID=A0ABQ5GUK0_9ASTR